MCAMAYNMASKVNVDAFHKGIEYALEKLGKPNLPLKEQQYEILKAVVMMKRDVLAVLPTGFGKSLIYQSLGFIFDFLRSDSDSQHAAASHAAIVVVSPLNALMQDQVEKLMAYTNVCVMKASTDLADSSSDLRQSAQIIFAHPEVFVQSQVMRDKTLQKRVRAVVIDEAHLVEEWKDFRPAYAKLGVLGNYFPQVPIVGLTATANCKTQDIICDSLGLFEPTIIKINPDRENIYFASYTRKSTGDAKLEEIIEPLVQQLKQERQEFPLTLVYSNLETISDCYMYFSEMLGTEQYEPPDAHPVAKNHMFTLFHAQYPNHERQRIITELASGTSKLRILFVTVAFGIGVDIQNIRQVIHIGVPYTMEEYFQEAGRCGRVGLPSKALVYYNAYDISRSKTKMADVMREFVTASKCKREIILKYFGYETPRRSLPQHTCCDYHRKTCDCDRCLLSDVSNLYLASPLEDTSEAEASPVDNHEVHVLSKSKAQKLHRDLIDNRLSLHGSGRSCVGGVTLATGFSIQLIDTIIENALCLTSVERVIMDFPVFSAAHAQAIYSIVQKYH